ncbi:hypothetical protein DMI69_18300 [Escherichia coli]|nr:hypothetical protein [Escherichia coli]
MDVSAPTPSSMNESTAKESLNI